MAIGVPANGGQAAQTTCPEMHPGFTRAAQEGTSVGFWRAGVAAWAPTSLALSTDLLSSVIAFDRVAGCNKSGFIIRESKGLSRARRTALPLRQGPLA